MQPQIAFLAGMSAEEAADVVRRLEHVTIPGGRVLFEQGDAADGLYALASGAIGISVRNDETGTARRVARLRPPDVFGEAALFSGAPRSATAVALRDSHLFRLSREMFAEIAARHPTIPMYLGQLLSERLRRADTVPHLCHAPTTFAVIPITEGVSAREFGERLCRAFEHNEGGRHGCLSARPEGADGASFHQFEAGHRRTVYAAQDPDSRWFRLCLRRADHLLLLAKPDQPLKPGIFELLADGASEWTRTDLAVLQEPDAKLPRAPCSTVEAISVDMRLHVREGNSEDMRRLARLASGTARGLVLGGGGARGFAHLGVLKALEEAGMPIDFVGGTSMGAIVAASLAMGWSQRQVQAQTEAFFVGQNPLNDYTLPYHALTRGTKVDAGLAERFEAARIEELWLPFFCMSSNLTTGSAMVHRSGDLFTAVRASIAIPGLLPPVCSDAGILVDGGMMNNLPADVMADLERGTVLAVDVGSDLAFEATPPRSWRGHFLRRLLGSPDAMPGIAPLLLRAATVSGDAQTKLAVSRATAVLRPPLAGVDLRAWSSFEATAELGYRHTAEAIARGALDRWAGSNDRTTPNRMAAAA